MAARIDRSADRGRPRFVGARAALSMTATLVTAAIGATTAAANDFLRVVHPPGGAVACASPSACAADTDCTPDVCASIDSTDPTPYCAGPTGTDVYCCDDGTPCPDLNGEAGDVTCLMPTGTPPDVLRISTGICAYSTEPYCDGTFTTVVHCRIDAAGDIVPWSLGDCDKDGSLNGEDPSPCDPCAPTACAATDGGTATDDAGTASMDASAAIDRDASAATSLPETLRYEGGGSCAIARATPRRAAGPLGATAWAAGAVVIAGWTAARVGRRRRR